MRVKWIECERENTKKICRLFTAAVKKKSFSISIAFAFHGRESTKKKTERRCFTSVIRFPLGFQYWHLVFFPHLEPFFLHQMWYDGLISYIAYAIFSIPIILFAFFPLSLFLFHSIVAMGYTLTVVVNWWWSRCTVYTAAGVGMTFFHRILAFFMFHRQKNMCKCDSLRIFLFAVWLDDMNIFEIQYKYYK